jgi:hypothetical protein
MTNRGSEGPFELPAEAGAEPFEEADLNRRTNFQSRTSSAIAAISEGFSVSKTTLGGQRKPPLRTRRGERQACRRPVLPANSSRSVTRE